MTIRPFPWVIYKGGTMGEIQVTVRLSVGDDLKLKHHFSFLLSGPSRSGKISFSFAFSKT